MGQSAVGQEDLAFLGAPASSFPKVGYSGAANAAFIFEAVQTFYVRDSGPYPSDSVLIVQAL